MLQFQFQSFPIPGSAVIGYFAPRDNFLPHSIQKKPLGIKSALIQINSRSIYYNCIHPLIPLSFVSSNSKSVPTLNRGLGTKYTVIKSCIKIQYSLIPSEMPTNAPRLWLLDPLKVKKHEKIGENGRFTGLWIWFWAT